MFEYVGALHIHSVFSDGSGEVKEIADFANEADLDFIILTDHNTLRAMTEGYEGWYGKTMLLVGCEINDKENKNHLLAFNVKETFSTRIPATEYTKKVIEAGGLGFIAHPHEQRNSMKEHPPYPWYEWDTQYFTGLEIWNHMSQWMEGLTEQNKYNYFVHPLRSVTHPPKATIELWDKLNQQRRVVGIGGTDAHAHKVNLLGFLEVEVFPYKVLFKSIRTHVFTERKCEPTTDKSEFEKSKIEIYKALELGRCFVTNCYHGDAKGFRFFAEVGLNKFQMGDSVPLSEEIKLKVVLPVNAKIKLLKNGEIVEIYEGADANFKVSEKGAYRTEIYVNELPWIFSNHIRIGL